MIPRRINYITDWLQRENYKSFYLAFLRMGISMWLLKEVYINWQSMDLLFGQSAFVVQVHNAAGSLQLGSMPFIKQHYYWFMIVYTAIILLNILGIGRWFTATVLFIMLVLLQKMEIYVSNGGDMLARLVMFYLIFADSYQHFVLFKQTHYEDEKAKLNNLLSNLAAFSIMLQLCLTYFISGLAKINDPLWWHGEAVYYALSMERFNGTPLNLYLVQHAWLMMAVNYSVLLFELGFPLLIWIKKLRKPLLIAGLIFHLCIYIFLMIYGFEIVFVLIYGLFLSNDKLLKFAQKIYPKA